MSFLTECWDWINQQIFNRQVNSKFNEIDSTISSLGTVATSNDYNDLDNKPTIPSAPDLSSYELLSNKDTDPNFSANSDTKYSSQKAIKTALTTIINSFNTTIDSINTNIASLSTSLSNKQSTSEKNQANGYLGADSSGGLDPTKITQTYLYRLVTDTLISTWSGKQDSLGFTPENSVNKNVANGYLGLDSNIRVDSIEKLEPLTRFYSKIDCISQRGAVAYSISGGCTTYYTTINDYVSLFSDTRTMYGMLGFKLNAGATGYGWTQNISDVFYRLASNSLVNSCTILAIKNSGAIKSYSIIIEFGAQTINASEVLSGDALYFRCNPTINSGLWQVAKAVNNVKTYYNTTTPLSFDRLNEYRIIYNKSTETAYFYINKTLIYTITSVNYTDNQILNRVLIATSDATETNTERKISIYRSYLEVS